MNTPEETTPTEISNSDFLLKRYRLLMVTIGVLYPAWRFWAYYYNPNSNETWEQRGLIGVIFLTIAMLTYRFEYFRRNIAIYFSITTYIWFLQTFYLMTFNEMSFDYLIMGIVVISSVGASFLEEEAMMWYYLMCISLTGILVVRNPSTLNINFFCGELTALGVSYIGLRSLLGLFRELRASKENLQKRTDEFVALSSAVQSMFLPAKDQIENEFFKLAGFYRPVDGCGGDWWSYYQNGRRLTIITGDVTGHGPGPAMMTASIASYTRALQNERADLSIENILHALNKYLLELQDEKSGKHRYLMTVHALEIDLELGVVKSISAGAPEVAVLRGKDEISFIGNPGMPLGLEPNLRLGTDVREIKSGDRVMIFTDGIMEIDVKGKRISDRKIFNFAATDRQLAPGPATQALISRLDKLRGVQPQADDYTLVYLDVA